MTERLSRSVKFHRTVNVSFLDSELFKNQNQIILMALFLVYRERNCLCKLSYSFICSWTERITSSQPLDWAIFLISDAKQRSSDGDFIPQTRPRSNTLPKSFGSSLDQEDEENGDEMRVVQKEKKPTKEATLELILKRLKEKRVERCLPEDIKVSSIVRLFLRN